MPFSSVNIIQPVFPPLSPGVLRLTYACASRMHAHAELPSPNPPVEDLSADLEPATDTTHHAAQLDGGASSPAEPAVPEAALPPTDAPATEEPHSSPQSWVPVKKSQKAQSPIHMVGSIPDMGPSWSAKVAVSPETQVGLSPSPSALQPCPATGPA